MGTFEWAVTSALRGVALALIIIGNVMVFIDDMLLAMAVYGAGLLLLFVAEFLSYSDWKRRQMSEMDAGGRAVGGLLTEVVSSFALPLLLAAVFYFYVAKDGRVIVLLLMGYLAAMVRLGFRAIRILQARERKEG